MFSAIKTVVLGLFIGITATALVIMALYFSTAATSNSPISPSPVRIMAPTSVTPSPVQPSPTRFITPTFIAIVTPALQPSITIELTPSLTGTPDPIQSLLNTGGLVFSGPLSNAEQVVLYKSSLYYSQSTSEDRLRVLEQINGVGYGDPSNICGPLAIAILRDAKLVAPDVAPHDFWLLNPDAATDRGTLRRAFPADRFAHSRIITPLNKMDWKSSPLLPGDFLFIWHGSGGNFDHMLVVNRVDKDRRAYAVTNFGTQEGYVITETLLYDPNDPATGIFHTWTRERDAILGSTGFGGFDLWRRKAP